QAQNRGYWFSPGTLGHALRISDPPLVRQPDPLDFAGDFPSMGTHRWQRWHRAPGARGPRGHGRKGHATRRVTRPVYAAGPYARFLFRYARIRARPGRRPGIRLLAYAPTIVGSPVGRAGVCASRDSARRYDTQCVPRALAMVGAGWRALPV